MASRQTTQISSWIVTPTSLSDAELCELLATKCAKIASILEKGSPEELPHFLGNIPTNPETLELVARFCHGYELQMSAENVIPLSCVAHYLGMTETQSRNNLLKKALIFFEEKVLPSWNETVKAFRTADAMLHVALQLGLVGACFDSIIAKARSDPRLLGDPMEEEDEDEDYHRRPNARRRLFVLNCQCEDLTTLSLRLYEPLIGEMLKQGVASAYVASSLCNYLKKWVFPSVTAGDKVPLYKRNSHREIIEAVERLLPHERGLISCSILFQMLHSAHLYEASSDCRDGLEFRIGKNLHQATVQHLLMVSYDIECVRRLLKHFLGNYSSSHISGLISVAVLIEDLLAEMASDMDLKIEDFIALAEMSMEVSSGIQRSSDGIYKAIDIYLDRHRYLTESERERVCQPLDCHKMTAEACDHAAKNERLPVRVAVQVLFVAQLQLRDLVVVQSSQEEAEADVEEERLLVEYSGEERMRREMEKMSRKVMELERECCVIKKEIESDCSLNRVVKKKKDKTSLWREMKRKFGCITTSTDCNCHGNKKKKLHLPK